MPNKPSIDQASIDAFKSKELKIGFSYKDIWQNEHSNYFSVAKVMEIDVLEDMKSALTKAIAEGQTLSQFKKDLKPILSKKGWWGEKYIRDPKTNEWVVTNLSSPHRLKTIYYSNVRSARSAGQWKRAQATKEFAPYFIYKLGPSKQHRDVHESWSGKILHVDHPFWDNAMPPNGWGCKCYVTQITENQANKLGGVSENPKLEYETFTNPRTDRDYNVLKGCNPAWSSNSGKFRTKVLSETLEDGLLSIDDDVSAKSQIQSTIESPYFLEWWDNLLPIPSAVKEIPNRAYNFIPVGYINDKNIYDKPAILRLTEETAYTKKMKHENINATEYSYIQAILDAGELTIQNNSFKITHSINDKNYKLGFKVTINNEYILTTFHQIKENQK